MEKRPLIEKLPCIASVLGRIGAKIGNLFGSTKGQTDLLSAPDKQQSTLPSTDHNSPARAHGRSTVLHTGILQGLHLEQLLISLSSMIASRFPRGWSAESLRSIQTALLEITRYHLAGFSKQQILDEINASGLTLNFHNSSGGQPLAEVLYDSVVDAIASVTLKDPKTGVQFTPVVWDFCGLYEIPRGESIDNVRMHAYAKPVMAFVKGEYDTCAISSGQAASALGRHIFYQLSIISRLRRGHTEDAKDAGCAAQNGLQISPWHGQLVELTLGNISGSELIARAKDDRTRFQVRCFEGLRAFTNGDKNAARRILDEAAAIPSDLASEILLVKGDLARCSTMNYDNNNLTSLSFVYYTWPPTDGDGQLSFEEATRALPGLLMFLERSCYGDSIYCLLEHSEAFKKFLYGGGGGRVMKYCEIPDWVQARIRQLASGPRS